MDPTAGCIANDFKNHSSSVAELFRSSYGIALASVEGSGTGGSRQQVHSDIDEIGSDSGPELAERILGWDSWSGADGTAGVAGRSVGWDMVSTPASNSRLNQLLFFKFSSTATVPGGEGL